MAAKGPRIRPTRTNRAKMEIPARSVHRLLRFSMSIRRRSSRAFTLIELMVVVAIVGILATIGIVLFRKWVFHTRSVEALGMVQSIRTAQERWRAETGAYFFNYTATT